MHEEIQDKPQGREMLDPGPNQAEQLERTERNQEAQNHTTVRNQGEQMERPGRTQGGEDWWDRQPNQSRIMGQWSELAAGRPAYRAR